MRSICLHGPESTGKSTVGPRLAKALGGQYLPEYGRDYAEAHGTDFTMADLLAIARGMTQCSPMPWRAAPGRSSPIPIR